MSNDQRQEDMQGVLGAIEAADDFARRVRQITQPEWANRLEEIGAIGADWRETVARLSQPFLEVMATFANLRETLARAAAPIVEMMAALQRELAICRRLEAAGWLPHAAMPFEEIADEELCPDELSTIVERHFRENWPTIKADFLGSLAACALDEEAEATFREALEAHEGGLYRLTCRGLFPEIERLSRQEIHRGATHRITSQETLREAAGMLTPGEMASAGAHGMTLYYRLQDHLYANLTTDDDRERILSSSIPNRHAAVHGYAAYGTFKASLNAIIITEFIFRTISALKRHFPARYAA